MSSDLDALTVGSFVAEKIWDELNAAEYRRDGLVLDVGLTAGGEPTVVVAQPTKRNGPLEVRFHTLKVADLDESLCRPPSTASMVRAARTLCEGVSVRRGSWSRDCEALLMGAVRLTRPTVEGWGEAS